jgi:hypothetical protein
MSQVRGASPKHETFAPPKHEALGARDWELDATDDHYERTARLSKLDRVSLSDYGPRGWAWYVWCVAVVFITRYSGPRGDYLFDTAYLRRYGVQYGVQMAMWVYLLSLNWHAPMFEDRITVPASLLLMALSLSCAYGVSWSILNRPKRFRALFRSRATALRAWELVLWGGWFTQGIAYTSITYLPFNAAPFGPSFFEAWPVVALAWALIVSGSAVKMYAMYLSGLNNYYYYDMILDTPNERFVDSGIYRCFKSPTYHIGYVDGYGLALLMGVRGRGFPLLTALLTLASHVLIFLVDKHVEQRFVERMYCSGDVSGVADNEEEEQEEGVGAV